MMQELGKLEEALKVLDNPELGSVLALYRKSRGITQETLAEMIDCHPITISKLERKEMEITVEWAAKIIRAIVTLRTPTPLVDPVAVINEICTRRGLTPTELARSVGLSPSSINRNVYKNGGYTGTMGVRTLNKIIAWDNSQP